MVGGGSPSLDELAAAGVRRLSQGGEPFLAAAGAIKTMTEHYVAGHIGAPADAVVAGAALDQGADRMSTSETLARRHPDDT